jgi:hypothetical protein
MSDDLNDLLETKPESNKPKSSPSPTPTPTPAPAPPTPKANVSSSIPPVHSIEDTEVSYSPSRITNYKTLKAIGATLKAFAYGSGGGAILSIISALGNTDTTDRWGNYVGLSPEFYLFLFLGITGILTSITFAFMSESINVILDIEANSRQAAKTLGRILKAQ